MDRRELLVTLRDALGATPKYLGAPSFAYEIKTEHEVYTIDRQGTIKNAQGDAVTIESILNAAAQWPVKPVLGLETEPKELIDHAVAEFEGAEIVLPLAGHTGISLRNIVNMMDSKQKLIMKAFNLKEPLIADGFAAELASLETDTLENFQSVFIPEKSPGIILDFEKETITFRMIAELDPEKVAAFTELMAAINRTAKDLKHTSFKPAQDDNPKFAFRTWLTRLGMNGEAFKTTRKVLLANLEGNGAFRKTLSE